MVSPIASRPPPHIHPVRTPPSAAETAGPGKSAQSVGHRAKAAIAESSRTGLLGNIQGKVASLIAQGLDYAALVAPAEDAPPAAPPNPAIPADAESVMDAVPMASPNADMATAAQILDSIN